MEDAQKKEDAFSFDAWKEEDTLKENASSFFRSSSFSWWKEEGALEEGVLLRRVEEEDAPKENAFSFRDASASEEDATSSGASKQDAAPKEEDVSSSSGASKENDAYASTEENSSSSFGESKRRTFRRRRTRPPSPRQSRHVNGERRVRLEGGGHVLLLQLVEEGRRVRHRTAFACLVCSFAASCLLKRARLSTCLDFEEKSAISRLWSADQRGKVKTCAWSGARRRQVGGGVGSGGGK